MDVGQEGWRDRSQSGRIFRRREELQGDPKTKTDHDQNIPTFPATSKPMELNMSSEAH